MTQLSDLILKMQNNHIYISERSVQADKFIFAKLMHKLKKMNDLEYNLYLQMFQSLENLFNRHAFGKVHDLFQ
jgi:deoxyadenosine/deoxycytidine kinase